MGVSAIVVWDGSEDEMDIWVIEQDQLWLYGESLGVMSITNIPTFNTDEGFLYK